MNLFQAVMNLPNRAFPVAPKPQQRWKLHRRRLLHVLAPKQYQGVMMGSWMLVTGLASLFAGMIPEPTGTTIVATNAGYSRLSTELGLGSLAVGIALVVLIPFLPKLITDKAETPIIEAATVVPVA